MKAIFKFDLDEPADRDNFDLHRLAPAYYGALSDLYRFLRNKYKHTEYKTKEAKELIEDIYSAYFDFLNEREITIP